MKRETFSQDNCFGDPFPLKQPPGGSPGKAARVSVFSAPPMVLALTFRNSMETNFQGEISLPALGHPPVGQALYEAVCAAARGDNVSRVGSLSPAAAPVAEEPRSPITVTAESSYVCYHTDERRRTTYYVRLVFNGPRDRHGPDPDAAPFDAALDCRLTPK